MSEKIKSEEFPGIYYVKNGKKSIDWIYYCKFRYLGKLYNFRNLTKEFGVRNEKEANSKMEWLKEEARKSIELGLPNPLERKKIKDLKKSKIIEEKTKRTISEHWKYEITNYKNKRKPNTIKQYENFYNNYIEPFLGQKKPSEIKTKDIDKILYETNLKDQTDPYKSLLKRLLRPIMTKALADGEISSSVVEAYKFDLKLIPKRKKISRKTKLSHLEISQKLYKTIPKYIAQYKNQREEWQQLMYLQLLCGRRYGELFELTYENLDLENNKINVYADINKTQVDTSFPIPEESKEFLLKIKKGKIFKEITYGSYYMVFQRFKEEALTKEVRMKYPKINFRKIKEIEKEIEKKLKEKKVPLEKLTIMTEEKLKESISKEEFEAYKEFSRYDFQLTAHDTRSLFISTLVSLGEDSRLVDAMLDHKQDSEEIVNFYLDISEESKNKAYHKYWKALRS